MEILGFTVNSALKQYRDYEKLAVSAMIKNDMKRYNEFNRIANYYKLIAEKLKARELKNIQKFY